MAVTILVGLMALDLGSTIAIAMWVAGRKYATR